MVRRSGVIWRVLSWRKGGRIVEGHAGKISNVHPRWHGHTFIMTISVVFVIICVHSHLPNYTGSAKCWDGILSIFKVLILGRVLNPTVLSKETFFRGSYLVRTNGSYRSVAMTKIFAECFNSLYYPKLVFWVFLPVLQLDLQWNWTLKGLCSYFRLIWTQKLRSCISFCSHSS